MVRDEGGEGFKVTDRRGRSESEPTAPATPMSPPRGDERPAPAAAAPGSDLTGLFLMFATSALIALGETPDPVTGRIEKNLAQAGEAIEVLRLLRTKTEGNRTPEEDRVLNQLLYDLQMQFVRAKKAGTS
jgi:Domain of unknown function (DUF1844)